MMVSKDFKEGIEAYESNVYKRSEETFSKLQSTFQAKHIETASFNDLFDDRQQLTKESAVQTFVDLMFLNQISRVKLTQERVTAFSPLNVAIA